MPTTVTIPSPAEVLSNSTYRRALGLVLVFVAFVVWPQVFGVGPLSSITTTGFVSAYYDPTDNLLTANLDFSIGSGSTGTAVIQLANKDDIKADLPPTTVSVNVDQDNSKIFYTYTRDIQSLDLVKCVTAEGTDPIGVLAQEDDWKDALNNAMSKVAAQLGASPDQYFGVGNYRAIVTKAYTRDSFFGITAGEAVVDVLVCGYRPSALSVYRYTSTSPRLCFSVQFNSNDGELVAQTDTICNDAYAGSSVSLVSNGIRVGYVEYRGAKDVYVPPADSVPQYPYLVREVFTYEGNLAKGIYAVSDPQTLTSYEQAVDAFKNKLEVLPYSTTITAEFTLSGWQFSADSAVVQELQSLASSASNQLSNIRSKLITNTVYRVDEVQDQFVSIYKPYDKDYRIHDIQLTVYGKFLGLRYFRAVPRILAATPATCSDKGCSIEVRIKNDTTDPNSYGPVTVTAKGTYFTAQSTVYFSTPGEEKVVTLFAVPNNVTSTVNDNVVITAEAKHPIDPKVDTYTLSLTIQKSASCTLTTPTCGQDDQGIYYSVCDSITSPAPTKHYCAEGQACQDGVGCVDDVILSVSCQDPNTYVIQYQSSGNKYFTCPADTVCDNNLASQLKMPPCRAPEYCELHPDDPQCGGTPPVTPEFHVSEYRPSLKDMALGILLTGIALVVMP